MISRFVLALTLCLACKTSSLEQRSSTEAAKLDEAAHAAMSETRTVTQGPETVTTVVEEYAPSAQEDTHADVRSRSSGDAGGGISGAAGVRDQVVQRPVVLRRTTTIDQRGGVVSQSDTHAERASETHAAAEVTQRVTTKRTFAPASLLALWPYLLAAALAGGLWLAIKRGVRW